MLVCVGFVGDGAGGDGVGEGWGVCSVVSSLSGGWSGFGVGGFSSAFAWGTTLVLTRYCGPQASAAPTCVAAAAAAWRMAVVLVSRAAAPSWGVRVSWSW